MVLNKGDKKWDKFDRDLALQSLLLFLATRWNGPGMRQDESRGIFREHSILSQFSSFIIDKARGYLCLFLTSVSIYNHFVFKVNGSLKKL